MTVVNVDLRVPGPSGRVAAGGRLSWQRTQRLVDGSVVVLNARTSVELVDGAAAPDIDPGVYWFVEESNAGVSAYRIVPDVGPVEYATLAAVDPATLDPEAVPPAAWYAYTDTLSTLAGTSATAAQEARDAAVLSQGSASNSATAAAGSATAAGNSATSAAGSASTATTKAAQASTSATNAGQSELAAAGHATNAGNSASAAAGSAAGAESARGSMVTGGTVDAQGHLILTRYAANPADAGYVVGPPITLAITETTTGPDTPGTPGPTGLTGPKGDPGGFVNSTVLSGGTSLDSIIAPGLYFNPIANAAAAPGLIAGHLEVIFGANWIIQRYTNYDNPRSMWIRRRDSAGVWQSWRAFNTQRVDQTAGRAIYTWDDLNNREQLVYGDTGERDIIASHGNGAFAAFKIRRYGAMVHLVCVAWVPPANGAAVLSAALPAGFRNNHTHSFFAQDSTGAVMRSATLGSAGGALTVGGVTTGSSVNLALTYGTTDVWPATLPGIASGAIPNL